MTEQRAEPLFAFRKLNKGPQPVNALCNFLIILFQISFHRTINESYHTFIISAVSDYLLRTNLTLRCRVDSSKTVEVELQNGSIITGSTLSVSEEEIELQQTDSRTIIRLSGIREIRDVYLTQKENQWFPNPNYGRLFFSPTAQPLQKNSGYYQNIYVFFNYVAYSVSDNIAFTGGFSMIPSVSISNQLYFIT